MKTNISHTDLGFKKEKPFILLKKETYKRVLSHWGKIAFLSFFVSYLFFGWISKGYSPAVIFSLQWGVSLFISLMVYIIPPFLAKNNPKSWIKTVEKRELPTYIQEMCLEEANSTQTRFKEKNEETIKKWLSQGKIENESHVKAFMKFV